MQNWGGGAYARVKKGLTEAATVVGKATDLAKELAEEQMGGAKVLKDYRLSGVVATSGPLDLWKIYAGVAKNPSALVHHVAVWIFDKKALLEAHKTTARPSAFDALFEQQRRNCSQMARVKHPGVVKVIHALEENAAQMVLVTEAVTGSLRNVLQRVQQGGAAAAGGLPAQQAGGGSRGAADEAALMAAAAAAVLPSMLECKLGVLQLAETAAFLHKEAGVALCGLNTQTVILTADGGWKLAAFSHSSSGSTAAGGGAIFLYADPYPPPWEEASKPVLGYLAPELVAGWSGAPAVAHTELPAADAFSLAAVAAEALVPAGGGSGGGCGGTPLLSVRNNVNDYRARVTSLAMSELPGVPPELHVILRAMVGVSAEARPGAADLAACDFFQKDMLLRMVVFLDSMLQRTNPAKLEFLQVLAKQWDKYDGRLLRSKVLPPLIQELRNPAVQLAVLPVLLTILQAQGRDEFMSTWLSQVSPLVEGASGEMLQQLVHSSATLADLLTPAAFNTLVMPLLLRALDSGPTGLQTLVLRQLTAALAAGAATGAASAAHAPGALPPRSAGGAGTASPAAGRLPLDHGSLRASVLPRALELCKSTTSSAVRVASLGLLAHLALALAERADGELMLDAAAQVSKVDPSAGTAVGVCTLADALSRRWGADMTATQLLPLLCPLLVNRSLTPTQFGKLMTYAQGMLQRIQQNMAAEVLQQQSLQAPGGGGAQDKGGLQSAGNGTPGWDTPLPDDARRHRSLAAAQAPAPATTSTGSWTAPAAGGAPPSGPAVTLAASSSSPSLGMRPQAAPIASYTPGTTAAAGLQAALTARAGSPAGLAAGVRAVPPAGGPAAAPSQVLRPPPAASGSIDLFGGMSMPSGTSRVPSQGPAWAPAVLPAPAAPSDTFDPFALSSSNGGGSGLRGHAPAAAAAAAPPAPAPPPPLPSPSDTWRPWQTGTHTAVQPSPTRSSAYSQPSGATVGMPGAVAGAGAGGAGTAVPWQHIHATPSSAPTYASGEASGAGFGTFVTASAAPSFAGALPGSGASYHSAAGGTGAGSTQQAGLFPSAAVSGSGDLFAGMSTGSGGVPGSSYGAMAPAPTQVAPTWQMAAPMRPSNGGTKGAPAANLPPASWTDSLI